MSVLPQIGTYTWSGVYVLVGDTCPGMPEFEWICENGQEMKCLTQMSSWWVIIMISLVMLLYLVLSLL
jgi:hypothetical protein